MKPTPTQALEIIYKALRTINAPADAHDQLRDCVTILNDVINPKSVEDKPKK